MTELRKRMLEDMQLAGLSDTTKRSYIRNVRKLAEYYNRSPEFITEDEIRQFFLYLVVARKPAIPSSDGFFLR